MGIFQALKALISSTIKLAFPGRDRVVSANNAAGEKFNATISEQLRNPYSSNVAASITDYKTSKERQEVYNSVYNDDYLFKQFIIRNYGSYENYLQMNRLLRSVSVFNPQTDFKMDVTVNKPGTSYKSDHISTQEMLLELLSGVCTVFFIKKTNGASRRLTCTLSPEYIPSSGNRVRSAFFSPMKGNRLGVWDINAQGWKSFYVASVYKFIRDDTTSAE